jgi:hypothetical protein
MFEIQLKELHKDSDAYLSSWIHQAQLVRILRAPAKHVKVVLCIINALPFTNQIFLKQLLIITD